MSSYRQQIARSGLLRRYIGVLGVDVLVKGANILLLPVYLRLMSQEEFGLYGYAAAIVSTFALVFNLGMYVAQTRLYHEYTAAQRGAMLFTLNALLACSVLVMLCVTVVLRLDTVVAELLFHRPIDYARYRLPLLLGVTGAIYAPLLLNFFLVRDEIAVAQRYGLARLALVSSAVVGALILLPGEDAARLRILCAGAVELVIVCMFGARYVRAMRLHFEPVIAVRALRTGLPVVVSAVMGIFVNLGDRFFIERFGTREDLSVYNLAMTLASIIPFAFASFQGVWLPHLMRERDSERVRASSNRMVLRMMAAFAATAVAMEVVMYIALRVGLVEPGYGRVLVLLPLALATAASAALTAMYSNVLLHMNRLRIIVIAGLLLAPVAIGLNMVLVPRFDVYGAALSALCVNLLYLLGYWRAAGYEVIPADARLARAG